MHEDAERAARELLAGRVGGELARRFTADRFDDGFVFRWPQPASPPPGRTSMAWIVYDGGGVQSAG